jgi:hypothetical protein
VRWKWLGRAGVGLYLTIGDIRGEIGFAF